MSGSMSRTSAVSNPMKPTLQEQHESCDVELGHDDDTVEDAESQTAVAITAKLKSRTIAQIDAFS